MPFLRVETNTEFSTEKADLFLKEATWVISDLVNKPEKYIMCRFSPAAPMAFGGKNIPVVYMEMKSVGMTSEQVKKLSHGLTDLVVKHLNVTADNVYIEFANASADFWGCGGTVLG